MSLIVYYIYWVNVTIEKKQIGLLKGYKIIISFNVGSMTKHLAFVIYSISSISTNKCNVTRCSISSVCTASNTIISCNIKCEVSQFPF